MKSFARSSRGVHSIEEERYINDDVDGVETVSNFIIKWIFTKKKNEFSCFSLLFFVRKMTMKLKYKTLLLSVNVLFEIANMKITSFPHIVNK